MIIPFFLSGNTGMGLWSISCKQYLRLAGDNNLRQEIILYLNALDSLTDPIIICNACYSFLVEDQYQKNINPLEVIEVQSITT